MSLKKNKTYLFRISFCISFVLHVIAIASVNHMKIHSYLSSGNISFSNKTKISYKKKTSKEIMNIIFKQKQKDIQKLVESKQLITLPENETYQNIINDFTCNNESVKKSDFVFHLPTLTVQNSNEHDNNILRTNNSSNDFELQSSLDQVCSFIKFMFFRILFSRYSVSINLSSVILVKISFACCS